jgi:hypothetical protein
MPASLTPDRLPQLRRLVCSDGGGRVCQWTLKVDNNDCPSGRIAGHVYAYWNGGASYFRSLLSLPV